LIRRAPRPLWLIVPAMFLIATLLAVSTTTGTTMVVIFSVVGILALCLGMGLAITIAKRL
jgi:hypothetical protein